MLYSCVWCVCACAYVCVGVYLLGDVCCVCVLRKCKLCCVCAFVWMCVLCMCVFFSLKDPRSSTLLQVDLVKLDMTLVLLSHFFGVISLTMSFPYVLTPLMSLGSLGVQGPCLCWFSCPCFVALPALYSFSESLWN